MVVLQQCCCMSLRDATLVIVVIAMMVSFVELLCSVIGLVYDHQDIEVLVYLLDARTTLCLTYLVLVISCLSILSSAGLLLGIRKDVRFPFLIWLCTISFQLILNVIFSMLGLVAVVVAENGDDAKTARDVAVAATVFVILQLVLVCLRVHWILIVLSYYESKIPKPILYDDEKDHM